MRYIGLIILLSFSLGTNQLYSQAYLDLIQNPRENTTLQEIQILAEAYFSDGNIGRGSGYKQYKRWEYKMQRQINADGKLLNFSKLNWDAITARAAMNLIEKKSSAVWTALGPTNYTNGPNGYNGGLGRINVIAFHPSNANIIFTGMPAGGVWKTTDGGATWLPIADMIASIGVSGIAIDNANPNTIYILTGDGDGGDTQSVGVLKSTDGGATWVTTGLSWGVSSFIRGYKLLMHPSNSNIMFAATTIGLLKTTDGWNSWSNVAAGSFRDIEFKPGAPATVYATTANTFYRSTDTGSTWGVINTGLPGSENRAAIAVSPANANVIYYLAGPGGLSGAGTYNGLYRSIDSGVSFSTMSTSPNILGNDIAGGGTSDQSWYDLAIAVNPSNANNTITGGVNIWRSTNGGVSNSLIAHWYSPSATQYVHADIHDLTYNPLDGVLYCASDGGISKSADNGSTWTNIWTGLQIAQYYKISGVESNQNLLLCGSQDNGSNIYNGSTTIQHILGGDGMDNMIDYNNINNMYYSFQNGGLQRSTNGGSSSTGIQPGGSTGAWVTPYAMDASNPSIIYGGYDDVYRSTNMGSSWTNLGSDGRGAMAVGVNTPARLYASINNTIQTSSNTGASWTTITGPWPSLTITAIAVDPANANRVWITLGGYTAGQKVYESSNAGSSWTNISGSLPNTPALSIAYENTGGSPMDAIYIGMGVGVYYRSDVTAWIQLGTGLPNVPVFDLQINHTNSKIRAGTYGRGLWETPLFTAPVCNIAINNIVPTPTSCPTSSDGTLTVTASCSTCAGISYTITPIAPPGAPINQVNNGVFVNIPANSYNVSIVDTNDANCNTSWASNPVVVPAGVDTNAPAIGCPIDITVECGSDTSPAGTGTAIASDTCDPNPAVSFSDTAVSGCGNTEVITRTWTATDASSNSNSCIQIITVIDTTTPVVNCPANISTNTDPGVCQAVVSFSSPNASDGCGAVTVTQTGGLASGSAFPIGITTNIFDVIDACGNITSCSFDVIVNDNENPIIICPVNQNVDPGPGNPYTIPDYFGSGLATATDNCTVPISNTTQNPAAGSQVFAGVYIVTLTATDQFGNMSSCTFTLTVGPILGIGDDHDLKSILLYPNPATNQIFIDNPLNLNLEKLTVFDLNGRLIKAMSMVEMNARLQIDISFLSTGTYIFVIEGNNQKLLVYIIRE